jgi:hypothetical protein
MGRQNRSEVRSAVALSFDLYGQRGEEDTVPEVDVMPYTTDAELASGAAGAFRTLAVDEPALAAEAERQALYALAQRPENFQRSRVFDQIELAHVRFLAAEPEQACLDAQRAIEMAASVPASTRIPDRLRELLASAAAYVDMPAVQELRDRLSTAPSADGPP